MTLNVQLLLVLNAQPTGMNEWTSWSLKNATNSSYNPTWIERDWSPSIKVQSQHVRFFLDRQIHYTWIHMIINSLCHLLVLTIHLDWPRGQDICPECQRLWRKSQPTHTRYFKTGSLVTTLPDAWHYGVCTRTCRSSKSELKPRH